MVCVERDYPGHRRDCGFVVAIGDGLVLFHPYHDFYPEGYNVFRLADIEAVARDEREELWERILAAEGLMNARKLRSRSL